MAAAQVEDEAKQLPFERSNSCESVGSCSDGSPKEGEEGEDPVMKATREVLEAVQAICDAVAEEHNGMQAIRGLSQQAQSLAEHAHRTAREHRRRRKNRQSFHEFASMLSEEVVEAAEEYKQEGIRKVEEFQKEAAEYAERTVRKARSMIEDHFLIDEAFRMLGPLAQDANFSRDVHDWFNLVALVPVIIFNFANFSCPDPFFCGIPSGKASLPSLWTGQLWEAFWWTTFAYFAIDLLFVISLPNCVRSPRVIIGHHVATILYIMVPKRQPKFAWLMGCCMTVEVNTWFLIARRSFNKLGEKPFTPGVSLLKSLRLALVSVSFYVSWFAIRIAFYPFLFISIVAEWYHHWGEVGTPFNSLLMTPIIQLILMCMNFKWTVDLLRSKLKSHGKSKGL